MEIFDLEPTEEIVDSLWGNHWTIVCNPALGLKGGIARAGRMEESKE